MGRRKKEPKRAHRQTIAFAAEQLFIQKGIQATSVDEIAKAAGYSKATLYVYFKNKEDIVSVLVLESMKKLYTYIAAALEKQESIKERYIGICNALLQYQEEYPFYFKTVLDTININFEKEDCLTDELETFQTGEKINACIKQFLMEGIQLGEFRKDIKIMPAIFSFWGMLSGLIQMAANKEVYVRQKLNLTKEEFLTYGFNILYSSIADMP